MRLLYSAFASVFSLYLHEYNMNLLLAVWSLNYVLFHHSLIFLLLEKDWPDSKTTYTFDSL